MGYSCCLPGCKSNYKKDESNVAVFKFPSIVELRQKWLHHHHRVIKLVSSISPRISLLYR